MRGYSPPWGFLLVCHLFPLRPPDDLRCLRARQPHFTLFVIVRRGFDGRCLCPPLAGPSIFSVCLPTLSLDQVHLFGTFSRPVWALPPFCTLFRVSAPQSLGVASFLVFQFSDPGSWTRWTHTEVVSLLSGCVFPPLFRLRFPSRSPPLGFPMFSLCVNSVLPCRSAPAVFLSDPFSSLSKRVYRFLFDLALPFFRLVFGFFPIKIALLEAESCLLCTQRFSVLTPGVLAVIS